MSLEGARYDAVVIGAGFAGLVAARDLTDQGNSVLVLEARDRLGGRTWSTKYPGTDLDVELGGQYVLSSQFWPLMTAEIERYGIELHYAEEVEAYPTLLNGTHFPGPSPVPFEQIFDLERAAIHCVRAAARITPGMPLDHQNLGDLDVPLADFLAPLDLPPETYDYVTTVGGLLSFRFPEEGSALHLLNALAGMDLSPLQLWGATSMYIRSVSLLERIAADIGEVRLECPVTRVDQTGDDVVVTTADGETISASAVIVAVPMNVWNDIEFTPELSEVKRATSAERHGAERSAKALMRVRNAPSVAKFTAPRSAQGGLMVYSDHQLGNGVQLMVMYALASLEGDDYHFDVTEHESVARTLQAMLPGAELVDFFSHDYNKDPYSKGDWVSWKPGRVSKSHSQLAAPEGRLAFATADIAPKSMMLLEGAVESAHAAAHRTQGQLLRATRAADLLAAHAR